MDQKRKDPNDRNDRDRPVIVQIKGPIHIHLTIQGGDPSSSGVVRQLNNLTDKVANENTDLTRAVNENQPE